MQIRPLLVLLLALFLLGCRGKINSSSYTRIKRNMSLQEVEGLLGPGKEMTDEEMLDTLKRNNPSGGDKMTVQIVQGFVGRVWQDGKKVITVFFRDERVQQFYKEGF